MDSSLFMSYQNMVYLITVLVQLVIERHDTATRITEDGINSFFYESVYNCLSTIHFHNMYLRKSNLPTILLHLYLPMKPSMRMP